MKTILLTGRTGQVGHELVSALAPLGRVIAVGREQLDLTQPDSIVRCVRNAAPDIIVNAAGYTSVDGAESAPELARQVNATAPGILAEEARRTGALLVHYSTDYVFDGTLHRPYTEDDAPNPINTYGRSKLAGEHLITQAGCAHLILRASWIYSSRGSNFVLSMLKLAREKPELRMVSDQIGSPSWARALAMATRELLDRAGAASDTSGIYHFSAPDTVSRLDFALRIIELARKIALQPDNWARISPTTTAEFPLPAQRPLRAVTSKDKLQRVFGIRMPGWEKQLTDFFRLSPDTMKTDVRED